MTVGDLKNELEYLLEDGAVTDNTEIRMAQQPTWAFEYDIRDGVAVVDVKDEYSNAKQPVVYLEEGSQLGYLPEDVASQIGW